jgi:hypothetical protein
MFGGGAPAKNLRNEPKAPVGTQNYETNPTLAQLATITRTIWHPAHFRSGVRDGRDGQQRCNGRDWRNASRRGCEWPRGHLPRLALRSPATPWRQGMQLQPCLQSLLDRSSPRCQSGGFGALNRPHSLHQSSPGTSMPAGPAISPFRPSWALSVQVAPLPDLRRCQEDACVVP